jgi:RNA-directed DNA polymerase
MSIHHPEKPFERYADDIIIHCKTERQAIYMLAQIKQRIESCKLTLHPGKTKIVNLRGISQKKYSKSFDFLGFTIKPRGFSYNGKVKSIPSICVSQKSKKSILGKFRDMNLHKRRKSIEQIAKEINPILRGIINYYHEFWRGDMRFVWIQLNKRLLKWVKWEKDLYKLAGVKYLQTKYKVNPNLFSHWSLVYP